MTEPVRAFQWDLARQTERLDWLVRQLPRYAAWGYREVYLHLEDAIEYPSFPRIARRDAYTRRDCERLVDAAGKAGIGVVPIVNLLGHAHYLIKVPELRDLSERRAPDGSPLLAGQICPLHPRTLEVADRLIGDVAWLCTAGKIHVGLDESYALGQHPLSRAEIAEVGLAGHFGRHVQRLHGLVRKHGLRMGYWADMLALLPDAVKWLPAGTIAYDWYYYPFRRRPAIELHNFREYELAPALRAQDVAYWGCPMSSGFRHEPVPTWGDRLANARSWWERCRRVRAEGMLVTAWETARTGAELVQASDAAIASLWMDPDASSVSDEILLARGLKRVFGPKAFGPRKAPGAGRLARLLLRADAHAYAGYARWNNEADWQGNAGLFPASKQVPPQPDAENGMAEWAFFATAFGGAATLPGPSGASAAAHIPAGESGPGTAERRGRAASPGVTAVPTAVRAAWEFRRYLAARDAFVARGGDGLRMLRLALRLPRFETGPSMALSNPQEEFRILMGAAAGRAKARSFQAQLRRQRGRVHRLRPASRTGGGSVFPGPEELLFATTKLLLGEALKFCQELRAGRRAARILWRRTRRPVRLSPNEGVVHADALRLKEWIRWLRAVRRSPRKALGPSPMGGAWQFACRLHLVAPALQQVVLERQAPNGEWRDVRSRFLVEFTAAGARRRTAIVRCFAAPVEGPNARLRLAVRGVGQVGVSDPRITDGLRVVKARGWGRGRTRRLGRPAPAEGFPELDWRRNAASVQLEFAAKRKRGS